MSDEIGDRSKLSGPLKFFLGACAATVVVVGFLMILGRTATSKWERYADKLRSAGQPLTFAEIEARRAVIPDDRNSARIIDDLMTQAGVKDGKDADRWTLIFGGETHNVNPFEGIPRYMLEPSRSFLAQHRATMDGLRAVRDRPMGRFKIKYDERPIFTLLPHTTSVRSMSKLVQLDAMLHLAEGRIAAAVEDVELQFLLANTLYDEPTLISRLVQIAIEAQGLSALELVLRAGETDSETLQRMRGIVEDHLAKSTITWALWGERAFWIETCENFVEGKLRPADVASGDAGLATAPHMPNMMPRFLIRANQLDGAKLHTLLVDAAADPIALTAAADRVDKEVPKLSHTRALIRILMPSLSRAVMLHIRIMATLECARAGLAAEQYRMRTGRLPASFAELVPLDLPKVPLDPFDGQPLRLAVNDRGIIIYSIGEDRIDDGGKLVRDPRNQRVPDAGFRLLAVEHRVNLITEEPPPSDE